MKIHCWLTTSRVKETSHPFRYVNKSRSEHPSLSSLIWFVSVVRTVVCIMSLSSMTIVTEVLMNVLYTISSPILYCLLIRDYMRHISKVMKKQTHTLYLGSSHWSPTSVSSVVKLPVHLGTDESSGLDDAPTSPSLTDVGWMCTNIFIHTLKNVPE